MRFKRQPYYVCLGLLILFGSLIWGGSINPLWAEPFDESQPFNPPDEANPLTPDPTGPGGLLLRIVISLAVIVALSFFLLRLFSKRLKTHASEWIRVLDHLPLGPHQNIYLLDIAGEIVVLGVTEQNVIKIMDIDDPTLSEEMRLNATLNASASAESAARNWRRFWPGPPAKTKEKINLQVKNALPYSFHRAMEEQLARVQSKPKDEPDE